MLNFILALLDIVLTLAVIWLGHLTGKWAEQFAAPGNELFYYLGALVAVMFAGAYTWITIRHAIFKR